ncbi:MAG: hypothetical protein JNK46_04715 [Methylobacteriaceae bacterium]|nr:hypothetical protein [Methylobacteriaceae bacterium]
MHRIIIVAAVALTLGGCASKRQAEGTAAGAIGGAVVGGPVGAVVGGAAGAVVTAPGAVFDRRCGYRDRYGRWRSRSC